VGGDVYLGERQVTTLDPGTSSTGKVNLTIPSLLPVGLYYVVACADNTGQIKEVYEGNNCRYSATQVSVGKMDLIVSSFSAPTIVGYGKQFQITDITRNVGSVATPVTSYTKYFLTDSLQFNALSAGGPIGERTVPAGLGVGADSTGTILLILTIPLGSHFLVACADYTQQIPETDEKNNCYYFPIQSVLAGPDLVITSVGMSTAKVLPGGQIMVKDTTSNAGSSATQAVTYTKYYLKRPPEYPGQSRTGTYLGERAVAALGSGAENAGTVSLTIPANMPPGIYMVAACADRTGLIQETSEFYNCHNSNRAIVVQLQ